MISLRKHIDAYAADAATTPVKVYREILVAIARAADEATPYLGDSFQQQLQALGEALGETPPPDRIRETHSEANREIALWSQAASGYLGEKAREVREIMIAVANAAASTAERDKRYSGRFKDLTSHLQSIAKLEDLTSVRRSLVESAAELKSCAEKMATEGAAAIAQLTAEVSAYRAKLEESERRETTDALTSLLNRRGVETRIEERMLSGGPLTVAVLDLNGFKTINDEHGHVAGDDLLCQFSAELNARFRSGGVVGRWGGDEFVIVVFSGIEEAREAIERVRRWAFGSYRLKLAGKSLQVSVTAATGLAQWDGKETALELIARADKLMYREKQPSQRSVLPDRPELRSKTV